MSLSLSDYIELKMAYLLPAIVKGVIGEVLEIPLRLLMPKSAYLKRRDFLKKLQEGVPVKELLDTEYYQSRIVLGHDEEYIRKRIASYRELLSSVSKVGIQVDPRKPRTYPSVFTQGKTWWRLDGAHRASVYWFLGYERVEVWATTTIEVLAKLQLTKRLRNALEVEIRPYVFEHERG